LASAYKTAEGIMTMGNGRKQPRMAGAAGSRQRRKAWGGVVLLGMMAMLFSFEKSGETAESNITTISISKMSETNDADVRLGDIADIRNGDPARIQKLKDLVIGAAALPGRSRNFDEAYIRTRLKQSDVDLAQIEIKSSEIIEVSTKSIEISRKMIEDIVLSFLDNKIPWDKNRVNVKFIRTSENLFLPDRPYTYKVIPPIRTRYLGNVPLSVVFDVQGLPSIKAWATVRIGVETDVIVVQNPLNRNQIIEKSDVNIVSMDMADLPSNYISSLEDVVGKRTLRTMNPKEVLRTDIVELPPMVKRNDRVSIVAESESLRITAVGEVKESGGRGDRIKVVNLNSNKEIFARVLDPKTVRVEF
jgi:flagella basal body P-ring formation protein FlgA